MNKPRGIIVFGANAAGKSTLGREIARISGYFYMRHQDYYFEESEIPYTKPRADYMNLMLADIETHRNFVLSAVTGDFGDVIPRFYELAVHVSAPLEVRMERLDRRAYERHGERIRPGGDMYEQHMKFAEFARNRPLERIDRWAETLACPVIRVDGTADWRENAAKIESFVSEYFK